jgi:hypothetical protein
MVHATNLTPGRGVTTLFPGGLTYVRGLSGDAMMTWTLATLLALGALTAGLLHHPRLALPGGVRSITWTILGVIN